jgi:Holliday junction resolvase RusA-like endonuclease
VRSIVEFDPRPMPPVLRVYVHGAPHRRIHPAVLAEYRKALWEAYLAGGQTRTLEGPIDLVATFIDPTGPDLDNLITALFQALDGKSGKGPTILRDDKQISSVKMSNLFS